MPKLVKVCKGEEPMRSRHERSNWSLLSAVKVALFAFFVAMAFVLPLAPTARAATFNVSIVDFDFQPISINVQIGDTVTWTNNGAATHTVTSDGGAGPLNSGDLIHGATYSWTFLADGTYGYHCIHHSTMTATVIVGQLVPEYSSSALVALGLMVLLLGLVAIGKKR